jgi:NhaA family Na+:H+ antiporter
MPQALSSPIDEKDHIRGRADASTTLVWYGDYECDYCARAFPVVNELVEVMGDRLRLVYRHFPVASVHPHAAVAAQAAEAAGAQGRFWDMHDLLFREQHRLADADFTYFALKLELEPYKFQADLSSERFVPRVRRDIDSGIASGVKGTPTFFVNGMKYSDVIDVPSLIKALDAK